MFTYTTPFGIREAATLGDALGYATLARDASGYESVITDSKGNVVAYRFTSNGTAFVPQPDECWCGRSFNHYPTH